VKPHDGCALSGLLGLNDLLFGRGLCTRTWSLTTVSPRMGEDGTFLPWEHGGYQGMLQRPRAMYQSCAWPGWEGLWEVLLAASVISRNWVFYSAASCVCYCTWK
jgi:hypothetical protein